MYQRLPRSRQVRCHWAFSEAVCRRLRVHTPTTGLQSSQRKLSTQMVLDLQNLPLFGLPPASAFQYVGRDVTDLDDGCVVLRSPAWRRLVARAAGPEHHVRYGVHGKQPVACSGLCCLSRQYTRPPAATCGQPFLGVSLRAACGFGGLNHQYAMRLIRMRLCPAPPEANRCRGNVRPCTTESGTAVRQRIGVSYPGAQTRTGTPSLSKRQPVVGSGSWHVSSPAGVLHDA